MSRVSDHAPELATLAAPVAPAMPATPATASTAVESAVESGAPVRASRLRLYGALAVGILCISFSAIFVKWANVPGTVSALYRVAVATVVLALPFGRQIARGTVTRRPGIWLLAVVAGVFFTLDLAVWNSSLLLTSAANATLLGNDAPIFVGLGALLLFRERLRVAYWLGLIVALLGMSLIVGWDVLSQSPLGAGDLLALLAGVFYAGYMLATQRLRAGMDTLSTLWIAGATGLVLLLGYDLVVGLPLTGFSPQSYLALVGLGLVSQVAGWLAINYALGHLPASMVSPTLLGQPIVTALLAVPLLSEELEPRVIAGGVVALLGIYIVNLGVARRRESAAAKE
jgi:drug/metabolite transporter (DMT)-like permease